MHLISKPFNKINQDLYLFTANRTGYLSFLLFSTSGDIPQQPSLIVTNSDMHDFRYVQEDYPYFNMYGAVKRLELPPTSVEVH